MKIKEGGKFHFISKKISHTEFLKTLNSKLINCKNTKKPRMHKIIQNIVYSYWPYEPRYKIS